MRDKFRNILRPHEIHRQLGNFLEFLEDIIVLILLILLFVLSLYALYDIFLSLTKAKVKVYDLIPKFIYLFILVELFRLTIQYLKERRIDTSLIVKTTLIAVLREIIIKAPHFKPLDYIGIGVLTLILALMYYVPKYIFVSEEKFEIKQKPQRLKARRLARTIKEE
ncbi:phosphate-starvation-inducible PsiE family protein [Persephonella sp. KM09-Lau-8]|uniref:phosphate-starvation-inducible PsiE family protein n=1 Tax=Persephonella sp. KM09-Lau-8 TaxID=1158345 RepID=UPI000497F093|nr:phosphate-starvation-inducible PsiE family protein [Persephonella sp. KM09-Lau-8]